MFKAAPNSAIAVLYSGGLDSAILVAHMIEEGGAVQPIYVASGLRWQVAERRSAQAFCGAIASPCLRPMVELSLPLADLYADHWSVTGENVPDVDSPDEAVFLLGRNPLLLIKARLWCQLNGIESLAIGCLENNPFADSTKQFFESFEQTMDAAVAGHVSLLRPFSGYNKRQVMEFGADYPLELTFSCIAPISGSHCGHCNKCAERKRAFTNAAIVDRTKYYSDECQPARTRH